ncbi:MAG: tetratricopeptide repeat protein [Candidatus Delongbacteria bacterium]|nr:tetratricopeptide repeat protein [Candidatus Delongbacteria bacterium]
MFKLKKIFLILLIMLLSSCAYFNMYFNAKKSFDDAEDKRKMNNRIDKALYESSIKELSKILEFYPNSKWVDDALLMMGQSYYRQGKYDKAKRKYVEILTNYPESDLRNKAKVYLAEVEIALNNYDAAIELIEAIKTSDLDIDPLDLKKLNAEMSLSLKDTTKALNLYLEAANESESSGEKIIFLEKASILADEVKDHKNSANIYKQLIDNVETREKKFENTLKYSDALQKQGYTDSALVIIENILSNEEYDEYSLKGDIKLGELYYSLGEYQKSYDKLDEILRTNQKNRENGAVLSETAYYIGEYYFNYKKDLENALTMYDSSSYYDRGNDFSKKAAKRKKTINEFRRLKKKIPISEVKIDSTLSKLSRIDKKLEGLKDSITFDATGNLKIEKKKLEKDLEKQNKDIINNKMLLAEKYLYDIVILDSAEVCLNDISKANDLPHISSKALLLLYKMDTTKYSELPDSILNEYPNTLASNAIRKDRGLELITVIEDSAKFYFNIASDLFLDSLYIEAIDEYMTIANKFEDSSISPKIMKAAALIAENYLIDLEKAADIYAELKQKYPRTTYGSFASRKLIVDSSQQKIEPKQKQESEADRWYMMDRRND